MSWSVNRNFTYDPYFRSVSLLLHGDVSPIVDSSGTPKTITAFGNAAYSTAQAKFGSGSIAFDAAGSPIDRLRVTNTGTSFAFGSGDFTIEAWVYRLSTGSGTIACGQADLASAAGSSWFFCVSSTTRTCDVYSGSTTYAVTAPNPALNQWAHIAFTRSGGTLRTFLNGTIVGSNTGLGTSSVNTGATTYPATVGALDNGLDAFNGYIDDLRITKGVARYTTNFTPPTAPFIDTYISPYDPDAASYINQVEIADGQPLETGVRDAINAFVVGCKADGIWTSIKASCILAGARTLSGALVPLAGAAPTNFNFVSGDYNRKTGLVGDGSTKYLNSNRNNNADPQNSMHQAVWCSAIPTFTAFRFFMGVGSSGQSGATHLNSNQTNGRLNVRSRSSTTFDASLTLPVVTTGLIGHVRSSSTQASYYMAGSQGTANITSQTPLAGSVPVFAADGGFHTDARLAFYSIGESLDLALLDSRVSTLISALAAAIP